MVPANTLAVAVAMLISLFLAKVFIVSWQDAAWLAAFGALNLGLGLALFSMGARMIPAALAALVGTLEPVLGPVWVWLVHGEVPDGRTLLGGAIVFTALVIYLGVEFWTSRKAQSSA
jgi:drug/metabolite transporter (DMT)-like permease